MADAPELRRSLWRELFWKSTFRSRRERVAHLLAGLVITLLVTLPITYIQWLDSLLLRFLWIVLGVSGLHIAGWAVWLLWGRERFPLPAPDGLQSTA